MPDSRAFYVPAYAKINLTLAVLGRRADGYHRLFSVMQTISLHDTLRIAANSIGAITCAVDVPTLQNTDNLAYRAASLLRAEAGIAELGAEIELHKVVPMQAGLGGGSSDAACVLNALNRLWGLGLVTSHLQELSARLGSDVPFFIEGGTAQIEGRGEYVRPLADAEPLWLVIIKPPVNVSTAAAFQALTPDDYADGAETGRLVNAIQHGGSVPFELLGNSLERSVIGAFPEVGAALEALRTAGAPVARMSGSGPTVYAPFRALAQAAQVYERVRQQPGQVWLCHTITRAAYYAALPSTPDAG